jgi:hypothetical protein
MAILCRGCVVRIHTICWNIGVWAVRVLHIGRRWEKHLFKKLYTCEEYWSLYLVPSLEPYIGV